MRRAASTSLCLVLLLAAASPAFARADARPAPAQRPAALLLPVRENPDFTYLRQLPQHGFDIDDGLSKDKPLTWERRSRHRATRPACAP